MKYIFNKYSKNLPFQIKDQIRELNLKVIESVGPEILSELNQYFGYLKDSQTRPIPMARPHNVSSAGTRTLPSIIITY